AYFDPPGMRQILTALASFGKQYSSTGAAKAMESLIGWMYEASRFTANTVRADAQVLGGQLSAVLSGPSSPYQHLGITVGEVVMHFEVNAPSLKAAGLRQATDVMATVRLSLGGHTVHVVATALESKGERGVLSGIKQVIENLLLRFRKGAPVTTENFPF